jgi:hypothetical protein
LSLPGEVGGIFNFLERMMIYVPKQIEEEKMREIKFRRKGDIVESCDNIGVVRGNRMNYKEGDTVRIQSKEWIDAQEKDDDGGTDYLSRYAPFSADMQTYAGKTAKIIRRDNDNEYYELDIDKAANVWQDWMFDPDYKADEPLSAKDAIIAMVRDGETLYAEFKDSGKVEYCFNKAESCFETSDGTRYRLGDLAGLRRSPARRKRPMTRWEVLDWANSEASRGWVVKYKDDGWALPQCQSYPEDVLDKYQRARLRSDLSGVDESTIQGFEAEVLI